MALRSVVVQPGTAPSGGLRTVVLRPGGPKPKGGALDLLACALGVLLLVGSVALVYSMPDKDYVHPRYKLFFPAGTGEIPKSLSFYFLETGPNSNVFTIDIPHDNVVSVQIKVGFEDDMPASLPDRFRIQLYDPLGNPVGQDQVVENPPPVPGQGVQSIQVEAQKLYAVWTLGVGAHPQEELVESPSRHETQSEAMLRLEPAYHTATKGVWTVKVELLEAGDCPNASAGTPDPLVARQAFACARQQQAGNTSLEDLGNSFTLELVSWSYYVTCTETMEARDPKPLPSCK